MAAKRKSTAAQSAAKKTRTCISTVVGTISSSEHSNAVPESLRAVLKASVPIALGSYKSERHTYESEVVEQAAQALKAVEAALKAAGKEALAKQTQITSDAEAKNRAAAKATAESNLETAKRQLDECRAARKVAEQGVSAADAASKEAQKDAKAADKELQKLNDKKSSLVETLAGPFEITQAPVRHPAAEKKAVQQLCSIGKDFGVGSTLLQSLPLACKKPVADRTEFEGMVFKRYKELIEGQITTHSAQITEAEAKKAAKDGVATEAAGVLEQAKSTLADAEKAQADKEVEVKDSAKAVSKADTHLRHIWADMRGACNEQDRLAAKVADFSDIWESFNFLKEQEAPVPEPEPVAEEPAAEAADAAAVPAAPEA